MSGIATCKAAYDAVKQGSAVPLQSNFTADDFVQFKRGMAAVAKSVPSVIGGEYGHVYLLEDGTAYQLRTSKALPTKVAALANKPTFNSNATAAEIEQAKFDHSTDTEAYLRRRDVVRGSSSSSSTTCRRTASPSLPTTSMASRTWSQRR